MLLCYNANSGDDLQDFCKSIGANVKTYNNTNGNFCSSFDRKTGRLIFEGLNTSKAFDGCYCGAGKCYERESCQSTVLMFLQ
jgi:hypothetical protein